MAAAGCAASVAEVVSIPMDTTKVRLQIQGSNSSSTTLKYRGMTHTIFTIIREEGVKSLFRGLNAGIQRQMCFCGIRIGLYDNVRKLYGDTSEGKPKVVVKILASCTTASTAVLLFQPTEVVKIRMQAAGAKQVYSGALSVYQTIARREGMCGLWGGYQTNIFRLSVVNCTETVVYDIIKSYVLYKKLMEDSVPLHLMTAVGAGFVSCMITSPIDVVKTRYITSAPGTYRSPIHCAVDVVKKNGPSAFYKGVVPSMMRFGSWAVVFFLSYEQIKRATHV
jgi:solute carrier family 25 uncoupling protein 8/9